MARSSDRDRGSSTRRSPKEHAR
ncbi:MAG: hypothetical protein QOJ09_612, partial [Actinomycetota bacterium]|nr:hypothetical protein [Actinomycetota bacterium]